MYPENIKYTNDHEWIRVEGNIGTIGITHHAQGELGDIVYIDISDETATVSVGDSFGTIEAVKTVADLYSPVSGKIVEVNGGINSAPETVNSDPYGAGWIVKIQLSNPSEVDALMDVNAYKQLIGA
ncbi:MAG: glycine cleavage system protein GcvH [Candidatus Kapabacteria bacterium]|jgi:glycine cleavage system H protein|nr:glycine cleavage system protein GcvH [Candidatus Kapabacteria bacterium]